MSALYHGSRETVIISSIHFFFPDPFISLLAIDFWFKGTFKRVDDGAVIDVIFSSVYGAKFLGKLSRFSFCYFI